MIIYKKDSIFIQNMPNVFLLHGHEMYSAGIWCNPGQFSEWFWLGNLVLEEDVKLEPAQMVSAAR